MSSDSHTDSHTDDHGHDSHDSHGHAPAADVIPESSVQDMILKAVTIVAAGLLYFMAFSWMGVPLPEGGHGAGSEHSTQHSESGASEHSPEHTAEPSPEHSSEHH